MKLIIKELIKFSVPGVISTVAGLMTILVCTRILGDMDKGNYYLLAVCLPVSYFLLAIYESFKAATITLLAKEADKSSFFITIIIPLVIASCLVFIITLLSFIFLYKEIFYLLKVPSFFYGSTYYFCSSLILANALTGVFYIFLAAFIALKKPLIAATFSVFISVLICVFTYLFSNVMGYNWVGYIMALVLSSALGIVLSMFYVQEKFLTLSHSVSLSRTALINGIILPLKAGFPVFVSYLLILSNLVFINIVLVNFGASVLTGFSIAYRIQSVAIIPAIAMGTAMAVLYSRCLYSKNYQTAEQILLVGFAGCILIYMVISVFLYINKISIIHFITSDQSVVLPAATYLCYLSLTYIAMGPFLAYLTMLEQTGSGKKALMINSVYFILSMVLGISLTAYFNNYKYLYLSIAIINVMTFLYVVTMLLIRYLMRSGNKFLNLRRNEKCTITSLS
ncbi:MAG: MATE family efflux transporter [Legionellales bacterium]|nr:MATE family efflux transporter [Legionellales bacterium]